MNADLPTSIPAYLERLRRALDGCDPALAQDALYDAEDYLRSELAANPQKSEAEVIAAVAGSYGAPDEVADIYRDTETRVQTALRPPAPRPRTSLLGRFFGVLVDPHTYGSLFYMLLALATGTFYFAWVVTGASLSLGLAVLIIGIPFFILFVGATRILALVEGRIVEVMLGERMPRRPLYSDRTQPWLQRIMAMFTDPRTWGTMLYFLAMLPLGIVYFTLAVVGLSLSLALVALPPRKPCICRAISRPPSTRAPAPPTAAPAPGTGKTAPATTSRCGPRRPPATFAAAKPSPTSTTAPTRCAR